MTNDTLVPDAPMRIACRHPAVIRSEHFLHQHRSIAPLPVLP